MATLQTGSNLPAQVFISCSFFLLLIGTAVADSEEAKSTGGTICPISGYRVLDYMLDKWPEWTRKHLDPKSTSPTHFHNVCKAGLAAQLYEMLHENPEKRFITSPKVSSMESDAKLRVEFANDFQIESPTVVIQSTLKYIYHICSRLNPVTDDWRNKELIDSSLENFIFFMIQQVSKLFCYERFPKPEIKHAFYYDFGPLDKKRITAEIQQFLSIYNVPKKPWPPHFDPKDHQLVYHGGLDRQLKPNPIKELDDVSTIRQLQRYLFGECPPEARNILRNHMVARQAGSTEKQFRSLGDLVYHKQKEAGWLSYFKAQLSYLISHLPTRKAVLEKGNEILSENPLWPGILCSLAVGLSSFYRFVLTMSNCYWLGSSASPNETCPSCQQPMQLTVLKWLVSTLATVAITFGVILLVTHFSLTGYRERMQWKTENCQIPGRFIVRQIVQEYRRCADDVIKNVGKIPACGAMIEALAHESYVRWHWRDKHIEKLAKDTELEHEADQQYKLRKAFQRVMNGGKLPDYNDVVVWGILSEFYAICHNEPHFMDTLDEKVENFVFWLVQNIQANQCMAKKAESATIDENYLLFIKTYNGRNERLKDKAHVEWAVSFYDLNNKRWPPTKPKKAFYTTDNKSVYFGSWAKLLKLKHGTDMIFEPFKYSRLQPTYWNLVTVLTELTDDSIRWVSLAIIRSLEAGFSQNDLQEELVAFQNFTEQAKLKGARVVTLKDFDSQPSHNYFDPPLFPNHSISFFGLLFATAVFLWFVVYRPPADGHVNIRECCICKSKFIPAH